MRKSAQLTLVLFLGLALSGPLQAAKKKQVDINTENLYIGGGLSINQFSDFDDAIGGQVFMGYELPLLLGKAETFAEVGFWNSGDFEVNGISGGSANGLWANGLATIPVGQTSQILVRAGLDFGDDSGLMFGGGLGIELSREMDLRLEYVARDDTTSIQANLIFRLD